MTLNTCAQHKKKILEKMPLEDTKEIWVYDYFPLSGYTTAGAYSEIIRLEEKNTHKFKLEQNDVDSLLRIMQEASPVKYFHNKWGSPLIFAEVILNDGQRLMIFNSYNVISIEIGKNYWINDEKGKEWLLEFRDRVRSRQYE